ncbi:hypothetical protein A7K93_09590 [Candidatus Methylacidiphilum fumarolicum]|uniref:Uncharacterized protein n=2 Tax=Candidatus Methylacidiphilum fumarolicum TaxID=591154 RepID=I0JZT4_METFB|nr:hypothetical protein [Candidatus Methylacidiphilum fumarolicum]MBW6414296.1 hypothetical protein [Candidatus Methylacidiphilum fumarolicum]TFE67095.1 hypothetical protein A7K73_09540 [Candidatus Methylacidiphilum fumarolicum]TFE72096.1 hypothetical protein A7K93_09590 [Candidatus Methylacidiphilum fumarolicum]TFE74082.1 hypothetical protein A7K72_04825 [Candidatus Methylacidiphilum fumarolicum]TFE76342.1 hypothetical protein A7D33_10060 [Candidatus Methylacidiphilum fumarolicum]
MFFELQAKALEKRITEMEQIGIFSSQGYPLLEGNNRERSYQVHLLRARLFCPIALLYVDNVTIPLGKGDTVCSKQVFLKII